MMEIVFWWCTSMNPSSDVSQLAAGLQPDSYSITTDFHSIRKTMRMRMRMRMRMASSLIYSDAAQLAVDLLSLMLQILFGVSC